MKKGCEKKEKSPGLARRSFMKIGGVSLLSLFTLNGAKKALGAEGDFSEKGVTGYIDRYWESDGLTPKQRTVKVDQLSNDSITARVEGVWRKLKIKELDQGFKDYQSNSLVDIYKFIMAEGKPFFGGVYCPAIISDGGIKRGDSQFRLNGAYKFVFPCPKADVIDSITDQLLSYKEDPQNPDYDYVKARREWMLTQWGNQDLWNYKILVGRDETVKAPNDTNKRRDADDIYPETHTFRNLMENPLAVLLFLSSNNFISYEVRTICHYAAPPENFTAAPATYEEKISRFINVLGYTSHQVDHKFPAMIFYAVEAFDNSMMVGFGEGTRVVKIKEGIKNLYAKAKDRLVG